MSKFPAHEVAQLALKLASPKEPTEADFKRARALIASAAASMEDAEYEEHFAGHIDQADEGQRLESEAMWKREEEAKKLIKEFAGKDRIRRMDLVVAVYDRVGVGKNVDTEHARTLWMTWAEEAAVESLRFNEFRKWLDKQTEKKPKASIEKMEDYIRWKQALEKEASILNDTERLKRWSKRFDAKVSKMKPKDLRDDFLKGIEIKKGREQVIRDSERLRVALLGSPDHIGFLAWIQKHKDASMRGKAGQARST